MSDIVNRALANLLAGQHQTNKTVDRMGQTVNKLSQAVGELAEATHTLAAQGDTHVVLIQELINAMDKQAQNSVPLRQKMTEIEQRLSEVERKVS